MLAKPIYKITLLGDFAVGKTSLRHRFMGGFFDTNYMMTIGADFASKMINAEGRQIKFQIWDLAGQPRFSAVRKLYYRSAVGALVVFDVTTPESLQNVPNWVEELWKHNGSGVLPIILLGNKIDLRHKFAEVVTADQGNAMAEQLAERAIEKDFEVSYLETSAKTGQNVHQAFQDLGLRIADFVDRERKQ
ncbi:MAG: GTP-binding protein [Candidatus Thorarchaeota archaeon]